MSDEYLLGSSTLPSTFRAPWGGRIVQLGEIVNEGHRRTGLSVQDWNALVRGMPKLTDSILNVVIKDWGLT